MSEAVTVSKTAVQRSSVSKSVALLCFGACVASVVMVIEKAIDAEWAMVLRSALYAVVNWMLAAFNYGLLIIVRRRQVEADDPLLIEVTK